MLVRRPQKNVVVFLFPSSRYDGVFCSFDRTDPFPVQQVIDAADGATVANAGGN